MVVELLKCFFLNPYAVAMCVGNSKHWQHKIPCGPGPDIQETSVFRRYPGWLWFKDILFPMGVNGQTNQWFFCEETLIPYGLNVLRYEQQSDVISWASRSLLSSRLGLLINEPSCRRGREQNVCFMFSSCGSICAWHNELFVMVTKAELREAGMYASMSYV